MPPYTQNVVFDNSNRGGDIFYADDDEVVGLEVRKKSVASSIWECLTGKQKKPEAIFLDDARPRQDLLLYERRCYDDDLVQTPFRCRPHSPSRWQYRWMRNDVECSGCIYCLYEPSLGRWHRPGPRYNDRRWSYNYYERGHGWDPALVWDPHWIPPGWRRICRSSQRRDRHPYYDSADFKMRKERIKLMQQRLDEERHERIYGEWPASYSFENWCRRGDRIRELDEKIEEMQRLWDRFYNGEAYDYDSDSDD